VITERTGCVTWPAEKSTSAFSIAGINSAIRKCFRTCCSSRKSGVRIPFIISYEGHQGHEVLRYLVSVVSFVRGRSIPSRSSLEGVISAVVDSYFESRT
jgi:hypothetical protein